MTEHGVMFPKVPLLYSSDSNSAMIWAIAALMCRVEAIWKNVCAVELFTSKWHGWMLVYLTRFCFNRGSACQAPNDPFKFTYISTLD